MLRTQDCYAESLMHESSIRLRYTLDGSLTLYTAPLLSTYVEWLPLRELRCDRRSLGVDDSLLTLFISHKINNVPNIDPMPMPAMEPPDILVSVRAGGLSGEQFRRFESSGVLEDC
jgi:hypothetical protein